MGLMNSTPSVKCLGHVFVPRHLGNELAITVRTMALNVLGTLEDKCVRRTAAWLPGEKPYTHHDRVGTAKAQPARKLIRPRRMGRGDKVGGVYKCSGS